MMGKNPTAKTRLKEKTLQSPHRCLDFEVDLSLYSKKAVLRTGYKFSDRFHVFLDRKAPGSDIIEVTLWAKDKAVRLAGVAERFFDELLDQTIREQVRDETQDIRTLTVAQAFAEGNLLEPGLEEADYEKDPLGVTS